jgi:solute carrier family 25 thiamine pyrophosphate transporter 19
MKTLVQHEKSPKVHLSDDLIAGATSGFVARGISAPFDLIKIRFQLQTKDNIKYTSMLQAFRTLISEEGFFSLWKGNLSATFLWISYAMVQFSTYNFLKNLGESIPDPIQAFKKKSVEKQNPSYNHPASSKYWRTFMLFLAGAGAG